MEYTSFGKTGRTVSRNGFGGTVAGLKNYVQSFDPWENKGQIITAIRTAYELGITYFDTAASYGDGVSEKIYGEALEPIPRDKIFLATKAAPCDGAAARASLERSLKNLRRDHIDLIQIHGSFYADEVCASIFERGGMVEAFEKAKQEGLVSHVGFTFEAQSPILYRLIRSGRFETMQMEYNLLIQHPYDPHWKCGSLYDAEKEGLGIVCMRTVTSGIFQRWIKMVNPANTFDYTPALLQLVLSNPFIDVALLGMRSADEVRANVKTCEDLSGRIDLTFLHTRYPGDSKK
jgi:aryl-alcohol dehydrogenase-like predicted oxidoreductase